MIKFFQSLIQERDGITFCEVRISGLVVLGTMLYQFVSHGSTDWQGFGTGASIVMGAMVAKAWSEERRDVQ